MQWLALFTALAKFFETILPILQELFSKVSAQNRQATWHGYGAKEAVTKALDMAWEQTWVWNFRTRAKLRAAYRVAERNAEALCRAAKTESPVPTMTYGDRMEIERA